MFKNVTEAEFQTIGPLYLHAVWYLPFTNGQRKHTVTCHFNDLQEVYHWATIPAYSVVPPIYKQSKKTYRHLSF